MGLVVSLAATAVPVHAAAPDASEQVNQQAAKVNWETIQKWKDGVVRGCRGTYDGESFHLQLQLVNRADRGRRGATISNRAKVYPYWSNQETAPIAPGEKATLLEGSYGARPRDVDLRAKVSTPTQKSRWSKVLRADRLSIC